ncbi:MAG: MFS transporter [Pirellulales bacterium]
MNRRRASGQLRDVVPLGVLFGVLYFVQGIAEPTEGLIAQPVRSLLASWGRSIEEIAAFSALLAAPWWLKPLYGALTDHVPLLRLRRKSYLLLTTGAAAVFLGYLAVADVDESASRLLFWCLLVPTLGVAFADVVVDALMVERGRPLGLTGSLQSVQWGAIYAGTLLAGWLGGRLSESRQQQIGFGICAAALAVSFLVCLFAVRERPTTARPDLRSAARELGHALRLPVVWSTGAFLFLWNFNPFLTAILQYHMTHRLAFSEAFYGDTLSLQAIGSIVASIAYPFYCRRFSFRALLHASIVLGIGSTIAYWLMVDETTAVLISLVVGFTYMSATLVQLDLAARACPLLSAGTVFALLMALSNLSLSLATWVGGTWYEQLEATYGAVHGFNLLVAIGAGFTAGCWLVLPLVNRTLTAAEHALGENHAVSGGSDAANSR